MHDTKNILLMIPIFSSDVEYIDAIDFDISCTEDAVVLYWEPKNPFHDEPRIDGYKLGLISIDITCYNLTTNMQVSSWCSSVCSG